MILPPVYDYAFAAFWVLAVVLALLALSKQARQRLFSPVRELLLFVLIVAAPVLGPVLYLVLHARFSPRADSTTE